MICDRLLAPKEHEIRVDCGAGKMTFKAMMLPIGHIKTKNFCAFVTTLVVSGMIEARYFDGGVHYSSYKEGTIVVGLLTLVSLLLLSACCSPLALFSLLGLFPLVDLSLLHGLFYSLLFIPSLPRPSVSHPRRSLLDFPRCAGRCRRQHYVCMLLSAPSRISLADCERVVGTLPKIAGTIPPPTWMSQL